MIKADLNCDYKEPYYLLEDGRVCVYQNDILGGRSYSTFDESTYKQQVLLFRRDSSLSNIGIQRVGIATSNDWLLFRQRLWDNRQFERTGERSAHD